FALPSGSSRHRLGDRPFRQRGRRRPCATGRGLRPRRLSSARDVAAPGGSGLAAHGTPESRLPRGEVSVNGHSVPSSSRSRTRANKSIRACLAPESYRGKETCRDALLPLLRGRDAAAVWAIRVTTSRAGSGGERLGRDGDALHWPPSEPFKGALN